MRLHTPTAPPLVVLLLLSGACATSSGTIYPAGAPARAVSNTPDRFMVGTLEPGGPLSEPQPGGCRNPMVDARDNTRLTLVQSQRDASGELGDYRVPEGRYGVRAGELLRLDSATGRAIGAVPPRG